MVSELVGEIYQGEQLPSYHELEAGWVALRTAMTGNHLPVVVFEKRYNGLVLFEDCWIVVLRPAEREGKELLVKEICLADALL